MGFYEVARVLAGSQTTGYERLALVTLAHRVKDERGDGAAWPSIDTFAKDVNCSERFIQKIVKGWRERPHEVYVLDGGGRFKSNHYVILVGCSFAEVVRRLMVNLNTTEQQAEEIAEKCGYQKGEHHDLQGAATTGKGEHYDSETVNIMPSKGEHYAETVNTSSPEQELNINLEPQPIKHPVFSSSPTPSVPVASVVQEEEFLKLDQASEIDIDLINAFAKLCKVSTKDVKLPHLIRQIIAEDPNAGLVPSDFRAFRMYYEAVRDPKAAIRYEDPAPLYVLNGWAKFVSWWQVHMDDSIPGYLPGVEDQFQMPRCCWVGLEDLAVGDGVKDSRWGRTVFYAKQSDGKFAEVPSEQWPDWAKESA